MLKVYDFLKYFWFGGDHDETLQFMDWFNLESSPEKRVKPLYIRGPQGCGKTVLVRKILENTGDKFAYVTGNINSFLYPWTEDIDYIIFDDMPYLYWVKIHKLYYESMILAERKTHRPELIPNNKKLIIISDHHPKDNSWLQQHNVRPFNAYKALYD